VGKRETTRAILVLWGARLRELRERADVSQATVAREVNPDEGSKGWASQVESGQIDTTFSKVARYVEAVGARLTVTSDDAWLALDAAIGALPKGHEKLQRQLRLLIADERDDVRPKKVRAG
jgi:transcriptional regulator with XRE-family HTH domain